MLLAGSGCWFAFWGGHAVVFQWLIVEVLGAPPAAVGSAQSVLQLPALLFLLVGGAVADRLDPTRLITAIHVLSASVVALLACVLLADALVYGLLLIFALVLGTLAAFGFPARDTLLSDVVPRATMSRAVTGSTLTQHVAQVAGALFAGAASYVGGVPVVFGLAGLVALGVVPLLQLPRRPPRLAAHPPLALEDLRAGVREVAHSPVLRPVQLLSVTVGLLFVGPYFVIVPLMVRDIYGGGAAEIALLNAMFPLGSVIGGLVILSRGGIERNGRALAFGILCASSCIGAMAIGLPYAGTALAILGWGMAGALFINSGRTLFQNHASEANRARVLSVYTLGIMGAAPLGSLGAGFLVAPLGLHGVLAAVPVTAASLSLVVVAATPLWSLR
jgi:MFS family permease